MTSRINKGRSWCVRAPIIIACLVAASTAAQTAREVRGAATVVPVFGSAALAVSPRVGDILVTVDDARWHWADASGNPVILQGLAPGRHKILIELANADHKVIDQGTVEVTIPAPNSQPKAQ